LATRLATRTPTSIPWTSLSQTTAAPVVSRTVLSLQTIVSREIDPRDPAVITVGSIQGGTKHNIIVAVRGLAYDVKTGVLREVR